MNSAGNLMGCWAVFALPGKTVIADFSDPILFLLVCRGVDQIVLDATLACREYRANYAPLLIPRLIQL